MSCHVMLCQVILKSLIVFGTKDDMMKFSDVFNEQYVRQRHYKKCASVFLFNVLDSIMILLLDR